MNERVISQFESRFETLSGRADELIQKLSQIGQLLGEIEKRFDQLPSVDDLQEFAGALPDADSLKEFAEAWASASFPNIEDLKEYCRMIPSADDLDGFSVEWDNLPSIDEVKEYARAASDISAGLQAAE